jgi:hypothetical protein
VRLRLDEEEEDVVVGQAELLTGVWEVVSHSVHKHNSKEAH